MAANINYNTFQGPAIQQPVALPLPVSSKPYSIFPFSTCLCCCDFTYRKTSQIDTYKEGLCIFVPLPCLTELKKIPVIPVQWRYRGALCHLSACDREVKVSNAFLRGMECFDCLGRNRKIETAIADDIRDGHSAETPFVPGDYEALTPPPSPHHMED
jgi:hypothetical protein